MVLFRHKDKWVFSFLVSWWPSMVQDLPLNSFSDPSLQISPHEGRDLTLLALCPFSLIPSFTFPFSVSHPLTFPVSLHFCFSHVRPSLSPSDSISCGLSRVTCFILFMGHMALPQPARKKKHNRKQWILGVSLISWYQSAPPFPSPPLAPLSFSSHVNWTSGGEVFTAPQLCNSLTKLEATRVIGFDELWKRKSWGDTGGRRGRQGCGLRLICLLWWSKCETDKNRCKRGFYVCERLD